MTEASGRARVYPYPTTNRRVMESEALRNAMAASARRRATAAHVQTQSVRAHAVPKHQLNQAVQPASHQTKRSRFLLPTIAAGTIASACLLLWRHLDSSHDAQTTVAAATPEPSRVITGVISSPNPTHIAAAATPILNWNASGLTPAAIEAKVRSSVFAGLEPLAQAMERDRSPAPTLISKAQGPRTKATTAASRSTTPVPTPSKSAATVAAAQADPAGQPSNTAAQRSVGDKPAGLPPGGPQGDPVASQSAALTAQPAQDKTTAAGRGSSDRPSNQLLQFPSAPSHAQSNSQAAAKQPSPPALRAKVLSVPIDGMVTVEIDGAVRPYRVGQTLPNGQTVLSADAATGKFVLGPPGGPGD